MMNSERAESQLSNIQAIEPLLSALKTLSLGSWQSALKKVEEIKQYEAKFDPILAEILPDIKKHRPARARKHAQKGHLEAIILIIGAERGLCGRFNRMLAEKALSWIDSKHFSTYQIWVMGSNMIQLLDRKRININWRQPLHSSLLKSYSRSNFFAMKWLAQFEAYRFDKFFLIFNQLGEGNVFRFSTIRLIPYLINEGLNGLSPHKNLWPPPILESNPISIYNQIIYQKIASRFFLTLQESSIAENHYRFTLLQDAEKNTEEMIQDLRTIINTRRRNQITKEMQELASSAGLLDN